ncbi:MAG: hypothetical protein ACRYFS_00870 [Janthinobacterium lividum]
MRFRLHNSFRLLLALLFTLSAVMPAASSAEAIMRCAGSAPNARPCARITLPNSVLTPQAASSLMMTCCRAPHCHMMAPMSYSAHQSTSRSLLVGHHCFVTIRIIGTRSVPALSGRSIFLPPVLLYASISSIVAPILLPTLRVAAITSPLSPHVLSASHGLRAPPAV